MKRVIFGEPFGRGTSRDRSHLVRIEMTTQAAAMLGAAGGGAIIRFDKPFMPGTSIHEFGGAWLSLLCLPAKTCQWVPWIRQKADVPDSISEVRGE